jgi:hypothetical protein
MLVGNLNFLNVFLIFYVFLCVFNAFGKNLVNQTNAHTQKENLYRSYRPYFRQNSSYNIKKHIFVANSVIPIE